METAVKDDGRRDGRTGKDIEGIFVRAKGKREGEVGESKKVRRDKRWLEVVGGGFGERVSRVVVSAVGVVWVVGVTLDPADGDGELAVGNDRADGRPLLAAGNPHTATRKRGRAVGGGDLAVELANSRFRVGENVEVGRARDGGDSEQDCPHLRTRR